MKVNFGPFESCRTLSAGRQVRPLNRISHEALAIEVYAEFKFNALWASGHYLSKQQFYSAQLGLRQGQS